MLSTSLRKGMIGFSPTTFMAVPSASYDASLTSGVVSLIVCHQVTIIINFGTTWFFVPIYGDMVRNLNVVKLGKAVKVRYLKQGSYKSF